MNRPCKNTVTRALHYISPSSRAHAEFCSNECRAEYWAEARRIGDKEINRQRRLRDNSLQLAHAGRGALVKVRSVNKNGAVEWRSGFFTGVSGQDVALRSEDGSEWVADLGEVEVSLPQERHDEALPLAGMFEDANLQRALDESGFMYAHEVSRLTCDSMRIESLEGLENLTNLTWLWLGNNQIEDISALANLTSLIGLDLWGNRITDIAPLENLASLIRLDLWGNHITDISPLARLAALKWLWLGTNRVENLSPLSGLTSLKELYLGEGGAAMDVAPLSGLTALTRLDLRANRINDVSPLAGLRGLQWLDLEDNRIADVSPLAGLSALTVLLLRGNPVENVTALDGLAKLTTRESWRPKPLRVI